MMHTSSDSELSPNPSLAKRGEYSVNTISYTSRDTHGNLVPISSGLKERARELRRHQTRQEALLWKNLRSKKLAGYKFNRQHPILGYIVDFYCHKKQLVVEVDGPIHVIRKEYDKLRDNELVSQGLQIIRCSNVDVEHHLSDTLLFIYLVLTSPFSLKEKGARGMSSSL